MTDQVSPSCLLSLPASDPLAQNSSAEDSLLQRPLETRSEAADDQQVVDSFWQHLMAETASIFPPQSSICSAQTSQIDRQVMPPPPSLPSFSRGRGKSLLFPLQPAGSRRRSRKFTSAAPASTAVKRSKSFRALSPSRPLQLSSATISSTATRNEMRTTASQPLMPSCRASCSTHSLNSKIVVLRTPLGYVLDLFDSCIAPTITTDSPSSIHLKLHIYRRFVQDLAQYHLSHQESTHPDQLFTIALDVFKEAHLIS